jgi:oligopeptide/dipeptide ABC transporter ATP-binding protein
MSAAPLVAVDRLTVAYQAPGGRVLAADEVSLTLDQGGCLGIVGESGSGKSTVGLSLVGLLPRSASVSGTVTVGGIDVTSASARELARLRGGTIGLVYQDALAALHPVRPIGEQIAEMLQYHRAQPHAEAMRGAEDALAMVGIFDQARRARQFPHEFSGGMRQRAAIAMALAARPRVLLADEPTTALDVTVQAQILRLLHQLRHDLGMAMIVISHNLDVIRDLTDTVAVMYHGRIVEFGATDETLAAPRHPYTRALMAAAPSIERPVISFIPGMPPPASRRIAGCAFEPRCDVGRGNARCLGERPRLLPKGGGGTGGAACHFPIRSTPSSRIGQ